MDSLEAAKDIVHVLKKYDCPGTQENLIRSLESALIMALNDVEKLKQENLDIKTRLAAIEEIAAGNHITLDMGSGEEVGLDEDL